MRSYLVGCIIASALTACAGNPQPIPVVGDAASVANLAGKWEGTYSSSETGRSGSIVFDLSAGRDTAFGDVLMIPAGEREPVSRAPDPDQLEPMSPRPRVLTVRFVQIGGDRVSGQLAPYQDPACGCTVTTTFEGRVEGDVIEGSYLTRHEHGAGVQRGTWKVERR